MDYLRYAFVCLFSLIALSAAQHERAGTVAFPFLNLEYDGQVIGLSGAGMGLPTELNGVLTNPGILAFVDRTQVMGGYRPIFLGVWGGAFGRCGAHKRVRHGSGELGRGVKRGYC